MPEPELTVRKVPILLPACDSGRHQYHGGETCEEYEALARAYQELYRDALITAFAQSHTPMSEVPPALRGPNWPGPA